MFFAPTYQCWTFGRQKWAVSGKVLAAPAANSEQDYGYIKPDGYWDINAPIIKGWDGK